MTATTLIPKRHIVQEIHRNGKEIRELEGIGLGSLTLEEQQATTANFDDLKKSLSDVHANLELSALFLETLQYVIQPYEMIKLLVPYHLTQVQARRLSDISMVAVAARQNAPKDLSHEEQCLWLLYELQKRNNLDFMTQFEQAFHGECQRIYRGNFYIPKSPKKPNFAKPLNKEWRLQDKQAKAKMAHGMGQFAFEEMVQEEPQATLAAYFLVDDGKKMRK